MGRARRLAIAGVIALLTVPAIALADGLEKPAAGLWEPYAANGTAQTDVALADFTVVGGAVKSMTFGVTSDSGENPGCPTGSVSVPGPLALKRWKFADSHPFWAFGQLGHRRAPKGLPPTPVFEEAPVTATLDGQPIKGAKLSIQFVPAATAGVTGDASGAEFDFSAKCGVSLSEDISQSQNPGNS